MTSFKDREVAEEAKYALDEETKFKVEARRNKLLGLWAAEKMGMTGDAAEAYAKAVVVADFEKAGDEDVFHKVASDLKARHVTITDKELRAKMAALREDARKQIVGQ
jgi:hypothetical protein